MIFSQKITDFKLEGLLIIVLLTKEEENLTSTYKNFSSSEKNNTTEKIIEEFTMPPINQIWDITVKMGEGFIIKIFSNPTTGYNWYIDNLDEIKQSNIISCINLNDNN